MSLPLHWLSRCALAALPFVSVTAFADDASTTLDEVVVTATRTAQTVDETLAPVTVITREDIERLQPPSLQDLLNNTPGMAIGNNGGPGKATSMFLRGTNSGHVLVLVDGIRIGSATLGSAPIQDIPVDQIERIEIVRGPFSSLYGSEAIGGVVQIFLRHAPGSFTPNAHVGVGSYSHWKAGAGFSAAGDKGWISVQAGHDKTKGINSCRIGAAEAFAACFANQPDRDGFRNDALTVHGAYAFNERWSADGLAMRSQGTNEYDGSFTDSDDYVTQVLGGQLHFQPSDAVRVSLRLGSSLDSDENFLAGVKADSYDTRRTVGSLQTDIAAGGGLITAGFDWLRESIASAMTYDGDLRIDRGVFAQFQRGFGQHSLQLSARHDDNSQFGGKTTGSLQWGWDFASDLRLTASYGTAFRAPSFNDLYYPGYGNPDLAPESSRNLELGLRGTPSWGQWSLNAYRNNVTDLIGFDSTTFAPANVDRVRITGLEGTVGTEWAGWQLNATATLLNARNDSADEFNHGKQLPRRPRQSLSLDADRQFGRFSVGAGAYAAARRYDDLANQNPLGSYTLARLRGAWRFSNDWSAQLAIDNAFDKRYETAWYFNQPGRNFMLTLNYRPAP